MDMEYIKIGTRLHMRVPAIGSGRWTATVIRLTSTQIIARREDIDKTYRLSRKDGKEVGYSKNPATYSQAYIEGTD